MADYEANLRIAEEALYKGGWIACSHAETSLKAALERMGDITEEEFDLHEFSERLARDCWISQAHAILTTQVALAYMAHAPTKSAAKT